VATLEVRPRPTPAERHDTDVEVEVDDHAADDLGGEVNGELVLRFEEENGIAKAARLTANGLDIELVHILTFT